MPIRENTHVANWNSNFGRAEITIKEQIGGRYDDALDAQRALVKAGEQGAIIKNQDGSFAAYSIDDGAYLDDLDLGEDFTLNAAGRAAGIVDFVGDDGATLEGGQVMQAPIGRDNGQYVYMMRALGNGEKGWKSSLIDPLLGTPNRLMQQDEMALMRAKGYTLVVDNTATSQDLRKAFYDSDTAGMVYLGHGGGGDLATYEKHGWLGPEDLDAERVSDNLKMTYFQACQSMKKEEEWEDVLGSEVYGWSRNATNLDVMLSNGGPSFLPSGGDLLNPYVWQGETLAQAIRQDL